MGLVDQAADSLPAHPPLHPVPRPINQECPAFDIVKIHITPVTAVVASIAVITHDKDFGFLTHYPLTPHPGIILIRLKMPTPKNVATVLLPFLMQTKIAKLKGRFTVVREGAVRII